MFSLFKRKRKPLFSEEQQQKVVRAIQEAERNTSGEIRVFIESHCRYVDAMDRARELFFKLEMERTELHNAVLIYIAHLDRQAAVFGDEGIYKKTGGDPYWNGVLNTMRAFFKKGQLTEGIESAVLQIGQALSAHFPYHAGTDKNELPDDIVFGA